MTSKITETPISVDDVFFVSTLVPLRDGTSVKMYSKEFLTEKKALRFAHSISVRKSLRSHVKIHLVDENGETYTRAEDGGYDYDTTVFESANRPYQTDTVSTKIEETVDNTTTTTTNPFAGMELSSYGKGYLLTPTDDHPKYGQKYFHNGWWMPSQNAWFFKSKYYDTLVSGGASILVESDTEETTKDMENMTFQEYGRGYLLTCSEDHEDYGTKYFHGGWWKPSLDGWFFKKEFLGKLAEQGATFVKTEETVESGEDEYYDISLKGMTFQNYGKGYFLNCPSNSPFKGIKYFTGGWWMPTNKGWFFKKEHRQMLLDMGAKHKKLSNTFTISRRNTRSASQ